MKPNTVLMKMLGLAYYSTDACVLVNLPLDLVAWAMVH